MDDLEGFVADDELAHEPLGALGWSVESHSWTSRSTDWERFDLAVIRTTWDYHLDPAAFMQVLETIHKTGCRLENELELVRWNLDKRYLLDLEAFGVPIVRTILCQQIDHRVVSSLFEDLGCSELVLKPAVSASAHNTFRLANSAGDESIGSAVDALRGQPYLAQAFEEQIVREGEFSLFFFDGEYSHTVLKTPKRDDFRVQEEHGGLIRLTQPTPALLRRALQALGTLDSIPLYARVDLVRVNGDREDFALMELELVEPALYFRLDPLSPGRFARALDTRMHA